MAALQLAAERSRFRTSSRRLGQVDLSRIAGLSGLEGERKEAGILGLAALDILSVPALDLLGPSA